MKTITKKSFENIINKVMESNDYKPTWKTVKICDKHHCWTPVDLICREYYNNNGGSAKGFLGITSTECKHCFEYIKVHQDELKKQDFISEVGVSNVGATLWTNYEIK